MQKSERIYVAGHRGMVGSALVRLLQERGFKNLILRTHAELDLRDSAAVEKLFRQEQPEVVILAAARVGGIQANRTYPAEFLFDNLSIQNNVIHQAYLNKVKQFCFLGSSCIYPRECPQPMKEEYLLTGPLEPTNEGYALAKIAGLKMVEFYNRQYGFPGISVMPCNLYGTNDSFDLAQSHVLSALVRKCVDAMDTNQSTVTVWGTGTVRREFLHVDDAAAAILFLIEHYRSPQFINVGCGEDITVKELAEMIAEKAGFTGVLIFDTSRPDGMPQKVMDVSRMKALGFTPRISLEQGVEQTIREYRELKTRHTSHDTGHT